MHKLVLFKHTVAKKGFHVPDNYFLNFKKISDVITSGNRSNHMPLSRYLEDISLKLFVVELETDLKMKVYSKLSYRFCIGNYNRTHWIDSSNSNTVYLFDMIMIILSEEWKYAHVSHSWLKQIIWIFSVTVSNSDI